MLLSFQPQGNSVLVSVTTAPSTPIMPSTGSIVGCRMANLGAANVFVGVSKSSAVSAIIPTTATPNTGFPLLSNSVETFNIAPNYYISAMTTSGTAALYITPGFGL